MRKQELIEQIEEIRSLISEAETWEDEFTGTECLAYPEGAKPLSLAMLLIKDLAGKLERWPIDSFTTVRMEEK